MSGPSNRQLDDPGVSLASLAPIHPPESHNRFQIRITTEKFAFPRQRKEPLENASHVRHAAARFNQVKGVTEAARRAAWKRTRLRNSLGRRNCTHSRCQPARQPEPRQSEPREQIPLVRLGFIAIPSVIVLVTLVIVTLIVLASEHHQKQDFARLNTKQQSAYWNWRHEHPDNR